MQLRGMLRTFMGLAVILSACRASGQFLVVPPKAEVIVPKVTGMMRAEAEKILTDAGLKVVTSEQEDPDFPAGTVLSQRPAAGKKASVGDEILLLLSKSKGESASTGKKTAARVSVPDVAGKSFSDAFAQLRKAGFTNISPQPVKSSEPKETVIGLLADAKPVDSGIMVPGESEIVVLVSNGLVSTAVSSVGGTASQSINTEPLVMTGIRTESLVIQTAPLVMTGIRSESIVITTSPLVMTGIRPQSITINTEPLVMTGIRPESITLKTEPLVMTGMREEKPKGPLQGKDTQVTPGRETDQNKKLELPFKSGANADQSQMKQVNKGGIEADTAANKILGEIPSMTTPGVPEKPIDGVGKPSLQKKAGAKKTTDKVFQDAQKTPVNP